MNISCIANWQRHYRPICLRNV